MSASRRRRQAGYTLVELIIAMAIGAMVLGALTSIVLTTALSTNVATSRVDASNQVRSFQLTAYDDMALSSVPTPSGCGTQLNPCTSEPMVLQGHRVPNLATPAPPASYTVTYTWDAAQKTVTRQAAGANRTVAENVTDYRWYVDGSGATQEVVVNLTVTISSYNATYSEMGSFRFWPRATATWAAFP